MIGWTRLAQRIVALAIIFPVASPAFAQRPISVRDSFPVGTGGETVCTAQVLTRDPAIVDMFDRGFSILCRDASAPVGRVYALRSHRGDPAARLAQLRAGRADCGEEEAARVEGLAGARLIKCRLKEAALPYNVYYLRRGPILFAAEGFAGYDSALHLALRSLHADAPAEGQVTIATTGAGDALSFARIQAGNTSNERLLAEAYRRNNAGNYAEAAEFFAALAPEGGTGSGRADALINQALQKSNLGLFGEAEELFELAEQAAGGDPVLLRQLRNQRAMHFLNSDRLADATAELERPIAGAETTASSGLSELVIDAELARALSRAGGDGDAMGGFDQLTPQDKMRVLDGQALQLRGSVLRLQSRLPEAVRAFSQAGAELAAVRGGRVAAALWMRAQILSELASIAESQANVAEAGRYHLEAIQLFQLNQPGSPAWSNAKGRYAAFLGRTGRGAEALALFREVVDANGASGAPSPALRRHLRTYFQLLLAGPENPETAREMFRASQLLVRPGIAQTQAVLARELSAGSDDAARLFRQALNQNRDVERASATLNRVRADPQIPPARIAFLEGELERLRQEQLATQARLAEFPQFRAVSGGLMAAEEMQALLAPGEAYLKMIVLSDQSYAMLVTPTAVRAVAVEMSAQDVEEEVMALRASISSIDEDGLPVIYPIDMQGARRLYSGFFAPFREELAAVRHLVFEPDGAMLRLPANLLIEDEASVAAYTARVRNNPAETFNFSGIAWLGRQREISTAISPRAFRDVRRAPPSQARLNYIGFGENAPLDPAALERAALRSATAGDGCAWAPSSWNRPISAQELILARGLFGRGVPGSAEIVTGAAFTDDGIEARTDLADYRIVHFATHGLLMPPRPQCPARPSLMTSFGDEGSDGLLSFGEIFNLRLDADIVILSACDTAGQASLAVNREAGIVDGGSFTFDGLVRAFVGAGSRLILASHWPVPDQYDATQRLISKLLAVPPGTATGAALLEAQRSLMDEPVTSHPFYWAAFAIVGDGQMPVFRAAD